MGAQLSAMKQNKNRNGNVHIHRRSGGSAGWRNWLARALLLTLMLTGSVALAQLKPVLLQQGRIDLSDHATSLVDRTGRLTIAEVMQAATAARFRSQPDVLHQYNDGTVIWLQMTVQQAVPQAREWWLEVQTPAAVEQLAFHQPGTLTVYLPQADGTVRSSAQSGPGLFPLTTTEYRNPLFSVALADAQPYTFYLQFKTGFGPLKEVTLWQPGAYAKAVAMEELVWGIYIGICLMLVLTSIWFERAIRDGVYLAFSAYVSSVMLMTLPDTGLLRQYFGAAHTTELNYLRFFGLALGAVTCIEFFFRFINMREISPRLTRYYLWSLRSFALLAAMIAVAGYFPEAGQLLSFGMTFFIGPSAILILFKNVLRGSNDIRMPFFVTALLFTLSIMMQFFAVNGYIDDGNLVDYSSVCFSVIFFLTIYYAISKRYQRMREATEAAQGKMLEMVRSSERDLERQVAARTQDLLQAMDEVERALSLERAAYEEQRQFIAMVSHELRTPLAVIDAAAQNMAREETHASSKTPVRLEKIKRATERLTSLFGHYLSNHRLDKFSQGVQTADVTLQPLLEDAVHMAKRLAESHQFLIETATMPERIRTDPDLLRLVLGTLVDNAVKYTPGGTRITLAARAAAHGWHIDIADTGTGIAEEEKVLIFERYYRGRAAGNSVGTGLGLSLARHLLERQGGTLTLLETGRTGATFRIFLPHTVA